MTSDCRGDARKIMPSRSWSYRGVERCIISIAQQASPKVMGHNEPWRAQFATWSSVVLEKHGLAESKEGVQYPIRHMAMSDSTPRELRYRRIDIQCILHYPLLLLLTRQWHLSPRLPSDTEWLAFTISGGCERCCWL